MKLCKCFDTRCSLPMAVKYIGEEVVEFVVSPSKDELSDICFAIGRLVGALRGQKYARVPGDGRCLEKMARRVAQHGCIRSLNHPHCTGEKQ